MFEEILEALAVPVSETFFLDPPPGIHVVWNRKITASGSDDDNEMRLTSISLDIFEPYELQSPNIHAALQHELDEHGISWAKDERIFYKDIRVFATTYTFKFYEWRN